MCRRTAHIASRRAVERGLLVHQRARSTTIRNMAAGHGLCFLPQGGTSIRRALAVVALTVVLLCGVCSSALADGDPASDYLLSQQAFVLLQSSGTPPAQRRLSAVVAAANRASFPIRVAVISSEYDLGSVSVLWKKPQTYARFLGIELSLAYKGLLLVAMPDGFGLNWPGHSTAAAYRALASVKVPPGDAGTITAAQAAVRQLASVDGVKLPSSSSKASQGSSASKSGRGGPKSSGVSAVTVLLTLTDLAVLIALGAHLLINRERIARIMRVNREPLRLVGLVTVAVAAAAVAVGVLILGRPHASPPKSTAERGVQKVTQETPTTWSEGQRPAPDFTLTDQSGVPISPASYRGRPVIITFIDPLCRNFCPLEAKVLNEADERLPAARRPQIIAVSVDIYADTHADLMLDFKRWSLVPQWQWAVGTRAKLGAVWRRYYAEVEVQTKHIAGTTVHYITHSEMAYIVDRKGYERALFSWPFSAKAIKKEILSIEDN